LMAVHLTVSNTMSVWKPASEQADPLRVESRPGTTISKGLSSPAVPAGQKEKGRAAALIPDLAVPANPAGAVVQ